MVESVSVHVNNGIVFSQYDVSGTLSTLGTDSSFYNQLVTSLIHQFSWQEGLNYITAVTADTVS